MAETGVRIKVCGLTSVADALACVSAGADWIGLNFHPPSPRRVETDTAAEIIAALPPHVEAVGLFVDRAPSVIRELAALLNLRVVQLHGNEPPEDLLALRDLRVIRAFRLGDAAAVERMSAYLRQAALLGRSPDAVLIDADVPGKAGGTGQPIADELFDLIPSIAHLILAGGLTPENVAGRIARVRPWMVDVASGVESSPGRKDPDRVVRFVQAVRTPSDRAVSGV